MTNLSTARTPWGIAQTHTKLADGIDLYTTASHGGIHLSDYRKRVVKAKFPTWDTFLPGGTWYEEDIDVAVVVLAFPDYFTVDQYDYAVRTARDWKGLTLT
jgi:hypothetical protein